MLNYRGSVDLIKMTKQCKRGHLGYMRADSLDCIECARERSRKQHKMIRADVIKWDEFQQRMREYKRRKDDKTIDDWYKKPTDIPVNKVTRRFRDSQRERYGISREQAAADLRLFRKARQIDASCQSALPTDPL